MPYCSSPPVSRSKHSRPDPIPAAHSGRSRSDLFGIIGLSCMQHGPHPTALWPSLHKKNICELTSNPCHLSSMHNIVLSQILCYEHIGTYIGTYILGTNMDFWIFNTGSSAVHRSRCGSSCKPTKLWGIMKHQVMQLGYTRSPQEPTNFCFQAFFRSATVSTNSLQKSCATSHGGKTALLTDVVHT